MVGDSESVAEIRKVLSTFNKSYSKRDLSSLDDFMNIFVQDDCVEFIATGGVSPGRGTWRIGEKAVRDLVRADWEYWGLVHVDEEKMHIHVQNDVAWLSAPATVITDVTTQEFLGDKEQVDGLVYNVSAGDTTAKPLRMTAILIKQERRWQFAQIHLSFSIRSIPI